MGPKLLLLAAAWLAAGTSLPAQQPPLNLLKIVMLPEEVRGRFEDFGVDLKNGRLFVAGEDYRAVLVLDLQSGKLLSEIRGVSRPHAIFYREDADRIYVTEGSSGTLKIFDGKSYRQVGSVRLARETDAMVYDPANHALYVVGGERGAHSSITIIDANDGKRVAGVDDPGAALGDMILQTTRPRAYVMDTAANRIVVVDRAQHAAIASWPISQAKCGAIALDETRERLFVGCQGAAVVIDATTGKEMQALPVSSGAGKLQYDSVSRRLYILGDGSVDVIAQPEPDRYEALGSVPTAAEATSAVLVPEVNRYFVAVPSTKAMGATIQVFETVLPTGPAPQGGSR
jgi:DNA-binding beta-propeller fold protein YncE